MLRKLAALPLAVLFLLPVSAALLAVVPDLFSSQAVQALWDHPQFGGALRLSLFTGLASTALALLLAILIVHAAGAGDLSRRAGLFLAVPHLSLALGLAFVIMPSGVLARLVAPALGWTAPPPWVTTQDPWGLALIGALVVKEAPFLVWAFASVLNRDDVRRSLAGQSAVARSLGHGRLSIFLRVVLPQLLPRGAGALVAVLAYGLTVVDMALVLGPGQPPTLAQLVWTDVNDPDPAIAARGGAGVLLLSGVVALVILAVLALCRLSRAGLHRFYAGGLARGSRPVTGSTLLWPGFAALYAIVILVMLLQSVAAQWPFPQLLPARITSAAWATLIISPAPLLTSLALALCAALLALLAVVAWLEWAPRWADRPATIAAVATLCIPSLLLGLGEYRLLLWLGLTGTWAALLLVHVIPVVAYVFLLLAGPYRAFDRHWQSVASGLSAPHQRFLFRIKWPMMKAPLWAAGAVGFAVSVAQFVPAQLAAAGRHATLPMEAVTLSAGGNRPLIATYGLALMLLPLAVFLLSSRAARPRWSNR